MLPPPGPYILLYECAVFIHRRKSFLLLYIPIWLRPFSFLSQPRLQKGKKPTSLLLFHWHLGDFLSSFFLSTLVELAGSMYWLGNCTPIFEAIGSTSVYFSHLDKTFTPFGHPWTRSMPKFFKSTWLVKFVYISASSKIHAHCGVSFYWMNIPQFICPYSCQCFFGWFY